MGPSSIESRRASRIPTQQNEQAIQEEGQTQGVSLIAHEDEDDEEEEEPQLPAWMSVVL
jgi:hypothetical protein